MKRERRWAQNTGEKSSENVDLDGRLTRSTVAHLVRLLVVGQCAATVNRRGNARQMGRRDCDAWTVRARQNRRARPTSLLWQPGREGKKRSTHNRKAAAQSSHYRLLRCGSTDQLVSICVHRDRMSLDTAPVAPTCVTSENRFNHRLHFQSIPWDQQSIIKDRPRKRRRTHTHSHTPSRHVTCVEGYFRLLCGYLRLVSVG